MPDRMQSDKVPFLTDGMIWLMHHPISADGLVESFVKDDSNSIMVIEISEQARRGHEGEQAVCHHIDTLWWMNDHSNMCTCA